MSLFQKIVEDSWLRSGLSWSEFEERLGVGTDSHKAWTNKKSPKEPSFPVLEKLNDVDDKPAGYYEAVKLLAYAESRGVDIEAAVAQMRDSSILGMFGKALEPTGNLTDSDYSPEAMRAAELFDQGRFKELLILAADHLESSTRSSVVAQTSQARLDPSGN